MTDHFIFLSIVSDYDRIHIQHFDFKKAQKTNVFDNQIHLYIILDVIPKNFNNLSLHITSPYKAKDSFQSPSLFLL